MQVGLSCASQHLLQGGANIVDGLSAALREQKPNRDEKRNDNWAESRMHGSILYVTEDRARGMRNTTYRRWPRLTVISNAYGKDRIPSGLG